MVTQKYCKTQHLHVDLPWELIKLLRVAIPAGTLFYQRVKQQISNAQLSVTAQLVDDYRVGFLEHMRAFDDLLGIAFYAIGISIDQAV